MTLNDRFKAFRLSTTLSQLDFAEKLQVSQATVSDIERNKIGVSKNVIRKLKEKFSIDFPDFGAPVKAEKEDITKVSTEKLVPPVGAPLAQAIKHPDFTDEINEKEKQYRRLFATQEKEIHLNLATTDPEIHDILTLVSHIGDVESFFASLNFSHIAFADNQELKTENYFINGRFDKAKFKTDYLKSYRRLLFLKPALEKFIQASKELFEFISRNDEDDVVYNSIPSGWIDEKVRVIFPDRKS